MKKRNKLVVIIEGSSKNRKEQENITKNRDYSQSIISRLSNHAFGVHAISIGFMTLTIEIIASSDSIVLLIGEIGIILILWIVSSKYLQIERYYRALDNETNYEYGLNYTKYIEELKIDRTCISKTMFSWATCPIYLPEIIFIILVYLFV